MAPQPIGVFVIVTRNNKILLGKRKNAYRSGSYGCPGGRLELTESLVDRARRELWEETGVHAISLKYLGTIRELQDDNNFIHFVFQCDKYEGKVSVAEPDKCESWDFYPVGSLPSPILPGHKAGIDLLRTPAPTYVDKLN